ncbi:MAG: phosphate--acyl-ACP acyltransferase, partial [Eubacteriales bacterium]|nr:phosphate--acyl-ACP acyltransferase [Eubacteriales bacterium]
MRIILDGMGGDNAPAAIVEGAVKAAEEIEDEIYIIGIENIINEELKKYKYDENRIRVFNADEVISNQEAPVKAVRTKKGSSLVKGIGMLKEGEGDIFISAGSTGALMAAGLFTLGRIPGIDRPAIAAIYPMMGGIPSLLVDAGANSECKPDNLLEFAIMGSIYMEKVLDRKNPGVGLVNIGEEENKG